MSRFNLIDQGKAAWDIFSGNAGADVDLIPGLSNPLAQGSDMGTWQRTEREATTNANLNNAQLMRKLGDTGSVPGDNVGLELTDLPSAGGGGGYSAAFTQSLLDSAQRGIQQNYDSTLGILDENRNFLNQQAGDLIGQTDKQYGQQIAGFDAQMKGANRDLDRSQQEIDANRQDAFSDLTSDLRAQMDSFTRYLGAMGAADSSAAGMGQYAFSRLGQQARSEIWKHANKLSAEVGVRREKLGETYRDNIRQLNDWKSNQLDAIQNDLKAKLQQLNQAKMQADATRLQQLNDLEVQIKQQSLSSALSVDQRVASMSQANQQWAQAQTQSLSNLADQINKSMASINFGGFDGSGVETGVENPFSFSAADIQSRGGGQSNFLNQVMLPQNRRDEQNV